jgi:Tol biopolymer transport system component
MTHRLSERLTRAACVLCLLASACFRLGYELPELAELGGDELGSVPPVNGSELDAGGVLLSQPGPADAGNASGTGTGAPDAAPPRTDCRWGEPQLLVMSGVSGAQLFGGPHLSPDALRLYFSMQLPGSSEDVFVATRNSRAGGFGAPSPLAEVNSSAADGAPFVTADDSSIYFFSQRAGPSPTARDLYVATRGTPGGAFGTPTVLAAVNSAQLDQSPHLSTDGLELWLGSQRGNTGFEDVYVARRARTSDPFSAAVAVDELNSPGRDTGAALSADGLSVYYSSERSGSEGGFDLWLARRDGRSDELSELEPLRELNGRDDEFDPTLSGDEQEMVFVSNRGGTTRLWHALRECE